MRTGTRFYASQLVLEKVGIHPQFTQGHDGQMRHVGMGFVAGLNGAFGSTRRLAHARTIGNVRTVNHGFRAAEFDLRLTDARLQFTC
ncbi:hypothetical protein [Methylocaldum sp.]|uniref:hypothetical protein n=1 Tax=Methylocaldum sp. TaxID=1969727 RepID=UPI002D6EC898|nr:hypothetical protein [Methylocaldum sp.]HYE36584.1 hypothetical protein [Methylocaldum sp.]